MNQTNAKSSAREQRLFKPTVFTAGLGWLRRHGLLEAVLPQLPAPTRELSAEPRVGVWIGAEHIDALLTVVEELYGPEAVVRLSHDTARDSFGPIVAPLLKLSLTLMGTAPGAVFSRVQGICAPLLQGPSFEYEDLGPAQGRMRIVTPDVAAPAWFLSWLGTSQLVFELCKLGRDACARLGAPGGLGAHGLRGAPRRHGRLRALRRRPRPLPVHRLALAARDRVLGSEVGGVPFLQLPLVRLAGPSVHRGTTEEQLGDCASTAISFAAVAGLRSVLPEPALLKLAQRHFAPLPSDARASIRAVALEERLAAEGVTLDPVARAAEAARLEALRRHAPTLSSRPTLAAKVEGQREGGAQLRWDVSLSGGGPDLMWRALFVTLGPWASAVSEASCARVDAKGERVTLPLTTELGERLFIAVERNDPILGCPVRLLAQRVERP